MLLVFSGFSALVFLRVERASLLHGREVRTRNMAAELLTSPSSIGLDEAARLAGFDAFAWADHSGWRGDAGPWEVSEAEPVSIEPTPRWYGSAPRRLQLLGTVDGRSWRAAVLMGEELAILDRSARFLLFYAFLNAGLILVLGLFWLSRVVVRPVSRLAESMEQVKGPAAEFRPLALNSHDEIGFLNRSFNALMERIRQAEEKNSRYVSQLEDAYRRLEAAQERLLTSEKLAALGRLSAGIAHEIGNPLGAISGYLAILSRLGPDDETESRDILERMEGEAKRIDRIIRGLLDFSRPRAEKTTSRPLGELIGEVVESLRHQPMLKGIVWKLDLESGLPEVDTVEGRLQQVLVNLCINAADAMEGEGTLSVAARRDADVLTVSVEDTGAGIALEDMPHIFEPFFTTKPPGKGTGLGLAIAHQIVTALHGRIWAEQVTTGGTRFVLELPVARPAEHR